MSDVVLVSGDEDVRIGVVLAQQFGVRVHLLGIHPARGNQSPSLRQEADTIIEWGDSDVRRFLAYSPPVTPSASQVAAASGDLDGLIKPMIAKLSAEEVARLKQQFEKGSNIPQEFDRELLRIGRTHYGTTTLTLEKVILRTAFIRLVREV